MTATLTRNRDSLTGDLALQAIRNAGYDVRNDHPRARGTYVGHLNLAGFQSVVLCDEAGLPWSVLYSRGRRLLEFKTGCLINHQRVPLDPSAALGTALKFARDAARAALSETMTVTVRDRAAESPWGSGMTSPRTREVTISAFCAVCGGRRGEPTGQNLCDDGAFYWVQAWTNPCRHSDYFTRVLAEARVLQLAAKAVAR
jgi:hypothetical protein